LNASRLEPSKDSSPRGEKLEGQPVCAVFGIEDLKPHDVAVWGSFHETRVASELDATEHAGESLSRCGCSKAVEYLASGGAKDCRCPHSRFQVVA